MLVRCRNRSETGWYDEQIDETGWFGSKWAKAAVKGVSSVVKVVGKVPGVSTAFAPIRLARDVASGKNVARSIAKQGRSVVADTRRALPVAASVVSFVPGVGTGVGAGLSALSAVSQGKNLRQIAEQAALGAIPGGQLARSALRAGIGVARGQNVLKTVGREGISYARQHLPGGELAQRGLNVAMSVAHGGNVAKSFAREGVSYARQNLPGGQIAQRGINVASQVSRGRNVAKSFARQGVALATSKVPMIQRNITRPNFGLPVSISPENVARTRQISVGIRRPNYRPQISQKYARAEFRPLATNTRSWLSRMIPHMRGEVSGLSETGTQWIVVSGDTGSKIALKLTGNANRWVELRAINPKVMGRGADKVKKYGFPIYVGDLINLPASWIKSTAQTAAQSAPATPSPSTPPPVSMPAGDIAAQGQARTILAAWGNSDGKGEAGIPDYGSAAELAASQWTARDVMQGNSFAQWWRRNGGPPAVDDGAWSDSLAEALNKWAENKASAVANTALAAGGVVIPQLTAPQSTSTTATPTPSGVSLPSPWANTSNDAPSGSTPTQIALPTVVVSGDTLPTVPQFPVALATPTAEAQPTATKPALSGLTDSQKWGWGSMAAGAGISILVRLIA